MTHRGRWWLVVSMSLLAGGCRPDPGTSPSQRQEPAQQQPQAPYVSEVPEGAGAAVALVVDTSGSMKNSWGGQEKASTARRALEEALDATRNFRKAHPDRPVKVGVFSFSDDVSEVMSIQDYDAELVRSALASLPRPGGSTAIGKAIDTARAALYRSGAIRKYILVITDGENNEPPAPEDVAREIAARSRGAVSISLIAVDVDPHAYAFVRELGGDLLSPKDPAGLRAAVQQIYEGKILAEAADESAEAPAAEKSAEPAREAPPKPAKAAKPTKKASRSHR
jgi:hypothetical protein